MKIKLLFLINILCIAAVLLVGAHAADARKIFAPERGKTIFLVGQDYDNKMEYVEELGGVPAGFMYYTSIQELDGLTAAAPDRGAGIQHAQVFIDKYPNTVAQVGLYMVGALDDIVTGAYDANLNKLSDWIKSTRRPVYLRVGYEFDLPENGYDPEKYKRAFQYIVNHIDNKGVTNVNYVWHSYGYVNPEKLPHAWYPGDEYVDWVGVSFFSPFNAWNMNFFMKFAAMQGKPFMLAESTPYRIGVLDGKDSWKSWFKHYFEFIEENEVRMVCYISANWNRLAMFSNQDWGDSRVYKNRYVEKKWQSHLRDDRYLMSSKDLFKQINYE